MAKRTPPKVTADTPIGRDVDIKRETRRDKQCHRVTDVYVDRLIGASRKPGRPALSEDGPSPSIAFRPESTNKGGGFGVCDGEGACPAGRIEVVDTLDFPDREAPSWFPT